MRVYGNAGRKSENAIQNIVSFLSLLTMNMRSRVLEGNDVNPSGIVPCHSRRRSLVLALLCSSVGPDQQHRKQHLFFSLQSWNQINVSAPELGASR